MSYRAVGLMLNQDCQRMAKPHLHRMISSTSMTERARERYMFHRELWPYRFKNLRVMAHRLVDRSKEEYFKCR